MISAVMPIAAKFRIAVAIRVCFGSDMRAKRLLAKTGLGEFPKGDHQFFSSSGNTFPFPLLATSIIRAAMNQNFVRTLES